MGITNKVNQTRRIEMPAIILIKRPVPEDISHELTSLLIKLRSVTLSQPGYISGQTLFRFDQPDESLVISTWKSVEDWENWFNNPKRREIQSEIDALIGDVTTYSVYT
jgi:heme-degrading monooxygenase HmoA